MSITNDVVTSVAPRLARAGLPLPGFVSARLLSGLAEHQPDHSRLLTHVAPAPARGGRLDAVVVPTCRPFADTLPRLLAAADLAAELGGVLVLLCSKAARAAELPAPLRRSTAAVTALDIEDWSPTLPTFLTSDHRLSREKEWDTPDKRNVAVLLAAALGWRTFMFLDDDLDLRPDGVCVRTVRGALAAMAADADLRTVGWRAQDFPDNSVVCHGRRLVGLPQSCFVGGGALLVRTGVGVDLPFFPRVYNEDWLFLYAMIRHTDGKSRKVGDAGTVSQARYDPFRTHRAHAEELGDVVAEGMFQLLGSGRRAEARLTDVEYWREVTGRRHAMVQGLVTALRIGRSVPGPYLPVGARPADVRRLRSAAAVALTEALRTLGTTAAERDRVAALVVDFIQAWRTDLREWRKAVRRVVQQPETFFGAVADGATVVTNDAARRRLPQLPDDRTRLVGSTGPIPVLAAAQGDALVGAPA